MIASTIKTDLAWGIGQQLVLRSCSRTPRIHPSEWTQSPPFLCKIVLVLVAPLAGTLGESSPISPWLLRKSTCDIVVSLELDHFLAYLSFTSSVFLLKYFICSYLSCLWLDNLIVLLLSRSIPLKLFSLFCIWWWKSFSLLSSSFL